MVYGKRFFGQLFDRNDAIPHYLKNAKASGRRVPKISTMYQGFQAKYTLYLLAAIAGASLIFIVPAWYFMHENYEIFYRLAYDTEPALLEHLEREVTHLYFLFGFSFLSILGFSTWIGLKVTSKMVSPLVAMEGHMKKVTFGNWSDEDFRIRATDDFRQLANSYSYLYRSLRSSAISDLESLEKIHVDPNDREAFSAWHQMISQKRMILGLTELQDPASATEASNEPSLISFSSRRAS